MATTLMSVRATAEALGVHENTIRTWEGRGILRAVRLPGSGYRRFPIAEVEAVAARMRASFENHPSAGAGAEGSAVVEDRYVGGVIDASLADQD